MINITIAENGAPSSEVIKLGSQFENLDEVIQFAFPTDLEPLHKYVVAKTYDPRKKENITYQRRKRQNPIRDAKKTFRGDKTKQRRNTLKR